MKFAGRAPRIQCLAFTLMAVMLPMACMAQSQIKSIPEFDVARYKVLGPTQIEVNNKCTTASGEEIQAIGLARPNGSGRPAQLEVRFAPEWTAWLPMVWGAYWVLDLDTDYQLAAVGDPSKSYLWILSRTSQVSAERYDAVLQRLNVMGFDIKKLEKTPQN